MKNFSLEPIIVLIVFILIPLVNYVLERMRRRFEPPKPTLRRIPDTGLRRQAAPEPRRISPEPHTPAGTGAVQKKAIPNPGRCAARDCRDDDSRNMARLRPGGLDWLKVSRFVRIPQHSPKA